MHEGRAAAKTMNVRILSVEREYGSGGAMIAQELARRLGWKLWDHALTEEVAKLAKVSPAAAERHDERRDQQRRAGIGIVWTLSRALGPAKEDIYALEFLKS